MWILVLVPFFSTSAQDAQRVLPGSLTIEEVIRDAAAGLSDDVIVAKIKKNAKAFDLNSDEIVALKKSGVSETVVKFLLDPNLSYNPPSLPAPNLYAPPATQAAPPKLPADPLVLKVPPEPGAYYLANSNDFVALDFKPVVPSKLPGKVSSISGGMLKGHIVGSLIGPNAKTRVDKGPHLFYIRLSDKLSIDDIALLSLDQSGSRRDLDFGKKPGKPVFLVNSVRQFELKEVAPMVFKSTVILEKPGEYIFFILGSGDEKKGLLGKGYDFGVN